MMWSNVLKHVCNFHVWADGECAHGPLTDHDKTWLEPDSAAMKELRSIVMDAKWLQSFKFYTNFRHTGVLESYHNARLKFACKRIDLR